MRRTYRLSGHIAVAVFINSSGVAAVAAAVAEAVVITAVIRQ